MQNNTYYSARSRWTKQQHFIMLKNEMESYVRIGGEGFEKSYVFLRGVGGGQKLPKSSLRN